jgi:hypothetical protein
MEVKRGIAWWRTARRLRLSAALEDFNTLRERRDLDDETLSNKKDLSG